MRARSSSDLISGRSQSCGDAHYLAEDQTDGYHPNPTNHLPLKVCNREVLFVDSFAYLGSLITNDGSSSRDIAYCIAMAASAMYGLSNPLFRKHGVSIRTNINMYRALAVSVLLYGSEASPPSPIADRRSPIADRRSPIAYRRRLDVFKGASCVCSGNSTLSTKASLNAPSNQQHRLSYDNDACTGSYISTAFHPPSLFEQYMTSTQTSMAGKYLEAAPKLDGLIQSSTTSIVLASTPPMLPRWSLTDPSGRPLLAESQRSNPRKAVNIPRMLQQLAPYMGLVLGVDGSWEISDRFVVSRHKTKCVILVKKDMLYYTITSK